MSEREVAPGDDATADGTGVRVRAHPGLCQGWGNCHQFAPEVYPLDADGHLDLHLLDVPDEHAYSALLGASACPERAITLIMPNGAPRPPRLRPPVAP